jgi:hypothetical protein
MRNPIAGSIAALFTVLVFSSVAMGQAGAGSNNTLYNKLNGDGSTGGPAPKRDLSGAWTAQSLSAKKGDDVPPMTPLGQQRFGRNKSEGKFGTAGSNDPWKMCDPFGIPRGLVEEIRGVAFAQMPGKMVVLHQYQRIWRDVWMDGRELPKNIDTKGGPESRWYGYSVGHWDGDYTFVIDTVGSDDRSWLDNAGHPHSVDAHVVERYTRVDHNHMEMTVTVDDPKMYTKPFLLGTNKYLWIPTQETEEQFCVPSEALTYLNTIAIPAAGDLRDRPGRQ